VGKRSRLATVEALAKFQKSSYGLTEFVTGLIFNTCESHLIRCLSVETFIARHSKLHAIAPVTLISSDGVMLAHPVKYEWWAVRKIIEADPVKNQQISAYCTQTTTQHHPRWAK
jgi:hypothetical protein